MNKTILIVEDEKALLDILVYEFKKEGFIVLSEMNGKEGLRSAISNHPDLILLDIIMPVMDGLIMLGKLREDEWGKNVKVLLLTNLSDPNKITTTILNTVSGLIVKSDWRIDDIIAEVKKTLT